jgi:hypothetical protein
MNWSVVLVPCFLLVAAGCATTTKGAATNEPAPPGAATSSVGEDVAEAETTKKSDVICRREAQTGSRIKKKVCRSRAQMEEDRRQAEGFYRRAQAIPHGTTNK